MGGDRWGVWNLGACRRDLVLVFMMMDRAHWMSDENPHYPHFPLLHFPAMDGSYKFTRKNPFLCFRRERSNAMISIVLRDCLEHMKI